MCSTFHIEEPIGREAEFALADDLLQATLRSSEMQDARVRTLLIGGDAGIGKTTLMAAVGRRAKALGIDFTVGHCLDLASGVPFGPVIEALRACVADSYDGTSPSSGLAWLTRDTASAGTASLDGLVSAIELVARRGPMVFVIEDLHWADGSVRDAMLALARTCRAPLMLVLTYRSEELHRQHPFRPVLVELSRTPDTARIELDGLDAHGVMQIVQRRGRRDVGPAELAMLVARTEGNPLHVEELLAIEDFGISMMLNDLLLRHVERLSEPAARLARLASVGGSIVEPTVLREVSDLTPAAFDAALQESLSANVMVRHGEAFSFRHALLREAINDDLLPEERVALHAAYAEVLRARLASGSIADRWTHGAALALHAAEAHDLPLAFEASVWAGLAGKQLGAAAAADHFDRALELWDRVPDPAARVGMTKADLPRLSAIVLADVGVEERVWENLRQSVELLEPDCDQLAAARVYTGIGQAYRDLDGLIGRHDALQLALSLVGTDPSRELAEALIASASHHHPPRPGPRGGSRLRCCTEGFEPALDLAHCGLVVADLVGAPDLVAKARRQVAQCLWDLGQCPAAVEAFREAALEAKRSGQQGLSLEARGALAYCLLRAGQSDECLRVARAASAEAQGAGLIRLAGLAAEEEVTWLIWDGQFDAAQALYDEMCLPMRQRYRDRWFRSMLETARGNPAAALAVEEKAVAADESVPGINHSPRLIDVYEALPDTALLVSTVETLLTTVTRTVSPLIAAEAAGYGYRTLAIAAAAGLDPLPRLNELCADVLDLATSRLTSDWSRTWSAMHLAFAQAYRAQLMHEPAIARWRYAVELATCFGRYTALRPRIELAREELVHGDRLVGKERLVSVWQDASAMGAHWYVEQAAVAARRFRVPLPDAEEATGPLVRLTPREREVLDLVATGATNRAIASALFISEKTTSLHVSNVLSKLGVSNRGQAAAVVRDAHRDGHPQP